MKYSIIIVTFNAEDKIAITLESLYKQLYKNFEVIIIDGNSTDSTVKIIVEYKKRIQNLNYISEKDQGIYDAMNKGVRQAKGDYTIFLGAGDCLYDDNILNRVNDVGKKDIICGKVILNRINPEENEICNTQIGYAYLCKRHPICHQQLFAKTYLLKQNPFNISYKIAADQDWIMRMVKKGVGFQYIDLPVCLFDTTGVSNTKGTKELGIQEFAQIQKKYFPVLYYIRQFEIQVRKKIKGE